VLEHVGGALVAEARQAAPAELACSARPARVRCISLVTQATDAVAEARAPRQTCILLVQHQADVGRPAVIRNLADDASHSGELEEVACRAEDTSLVGIGSLDHILRASAAAGFRAVVVAREAFAVGEVVHDK
jgi:hypothetical protein